MLKSNKADVEVDIQRKLYKRKANHDQYKQVQTRCLDRDVMVNFETGEYLRKMIFQSVKQAAQKEKLEYSLKESNLWPFVYLSRWSYQDYS